MAYIKKLPTGRWSAQIYLGRDPATGKTRWESKRFDAKKDAQVWAGKLETQRDDGAYRPSVSKATFADYVRNTWLPMYGTQVRSVYNTEKTLGKWLFRAQPETPAIGRIPLRRLTASDFDRLYIALSERHGMRRRGIEHLHGLLKRALKSAVKKGELTRNPADGATIPKPEVRAEVTQEDMEQEGPVRYLNREQVTRLLLVAKEHRWSALWHLLLDAGLRPGEAFALNWAQVDLDAKLVKVRATLTRTQRDDRKEGWKLTKPKTKRSSRDVPISDATAWQLRLWKKRQAEERKRLGPDWTEHGFVFTTEFGSPLGNNVHLAWAKLLREADGGRGDLVTWAPEAKKELRKRGRPAHRKAHPRFVLYVLRHTCATLALLDGVDLLQVSRRLGHTDLAFTARMYGHLKAEHTTQAAESFNRLAASVG
jgi:integrase